MVGFYARFIPIYSGIATTLHELKKKGVPFCWGEPQQAAFEALKRALQHLRGVPFCPFRMRKVQALP